MAEASASASPSFKNKMASGDHPEAILSYSKNPLTNSGPAMWQVSGRQFAYWANWWTRSGSNRRPPQCHCGALPAALRAHEGKDPPFLIELLPRCKREIPLPRTQRKDLIFRGRKRVEASCSDVWDFGFCLF